MLPPTEYFYFGELIEIFNYDVRKLDQINVWLKSSSVEKLFASLMNKYGINKNNGRELKESQWPQNGTEFFLVETILVSQTQREYDNKSVWSN